MTIGTGEKVSNCGLFDWDAELYAQLHALAVNRLGHGKPSGTLGATALVHEAYLRLQKAEALEAPPHELLAMASYAIRSALIDKARAKQAQKRGGLASRCPLDDALCVYEERVESLLGVEDALTRLQQLDSRLAEIVTLRFFGGLSENEIATLLDVSTRTVRRDWQLARAWFRKELAGWSDE